MLHLKLLAVGQLQRARLYYRTESHEFVPVARVLDSNVQWDPEWVPAGNMFAVPALQSMTGLAKSPGLRQPLHRLPVF
jgi:hypothetical protein